MTESKIISLWKSNYSVGKSILTLDDPEKSEKNKDGCTSIFSLLKQNNIKDLILLDNSPTGFFEAYTRCNSLNINLIYGLSFDIYQDGIADSHKINIFIKNSDGYKQLIKFYSYCSKKGYKINQDDLDKFWNKDLFLFCVPFYDSFLFKNSLNFCKFIFDVSKYDPIFFIEENGLPYDMVLKPIIENFCKDKYEMKNSKTILYNRKDDVKSYMVFRCLCSRNFGKVNNFGRPNLEQFGSNEFCFESYLEKIK